MKTEPHAAKTRMTPAKDKAGKAIGATAGGDSPKPAVTTEQRRQMISAAAYFRAEQRGFAPGRELDDWLAAEAEVEGALVQKLH